LTEVQILRFGYFVSSLSVRSAWIEEEVETSEGNRQAAAAPSGRVGADVAPGLQHEVKEMNFFAITAYLIPTTKSAPSICSTVCTDICIPSHGEQHKIPEPPFLLNCPS